MPAPTNERQSLEQERAELPSKIAAHQAQLDASREQGKARAARVANPEDAEADGGG